MKEFTAVLEKAWEDGFFYHLRYGLFNEKEYEQLKLSFNNFDVEKYQTETIDRRFISLLWFIPTFISWQKEYLMKSGVAESVLDDCSSFFDDQCTRILGMP